MVRPGVKDAMNISVPSWEMRDGVFSDSGADLLRRMTEKRVSGWDLPEEEGFFSKVWPDGHCWSATKRSAALSINYYFYQFFALL